MGMLKDKEVDRVIALTEKYADQILTVTPPDNPRAMHAYDLATEVAKVHPDVTAVDSLEEAVELSHLLAGRDDVILCFGSLSYLGRILKLMEKRQTAGNKRKGSGENGRSEESTGSNKAFTGRNRGRYRERRIDGDTGADRQDV